MSKSKDRGAVLAPWAPLPAPTISDPRKKASASLPVKTHLRTHTTYPKVYVVAVGDLSEGYKFFGPFKCVETAMKWAFVNLKVGESVQVYSMSHVRGVRGEVETTD